jgi:hypothetical protein
MGVSPLDEEAVSFGEIEVEFGPGLEGHADSASMFLEKAVLPIFGVPSRIVRELGPVED